jgi:hypothetical protein
VKTLYVCELCGNRSVDRGSIESCEREGRPSHEQLPPIGLIYGYFDGDDPRSRYFGFAWVVDYMWPEGHSVVVSGAVFRANGKGDDELNLLAGSRSGYSLRKGEIPWREWPSAPPPGEVLERAVAACRKAGVEPLVLRRGEAVPADV